MTTESGTSLPCSCTLGLFAEGVPALSAARSMSPVEIFGTPKRSVSTAACVPLPLAGAPSKTSLTRPPPRARHARTGQPS
jgi:hypothetical protein